MGSQEKRCSKKDKPWAIQNALLTAIRPPSPTGVPDRLLNSAWMEHSLPAIPYLFRPDPQKKRRLHKMVFACMCGTTHGCQRRVPRYEHLVGNVPGKLPVHSPCRRTIPSSLRIGEYPCYDRLILIAMTSGRCPMSRSPSSSELSPVGIPGREGSCLSEYLFRCSSAGYPPEVVPCDPGEGAGVSLQGSAGSP